MNILFCSEKGEMLALRGVAAFRHFAGKTQQNKPEQGGTTHFREKIQIGTVERRETPFIPPRSGNTRSNAVDYG
jgi:hypothetical protein